VAKVYQAYPEYKDSRVEWLGAIPKEWQNYKIKHLSPVKRGASPRPIDDPKFFDDDGEYAWVRIADVSASEMYLEKTTQQMSILGSSLSVKLNIGKLFLSIAGTVGKPCITKIKACIHDGFVYFPELKIPEKFLYYIFAGEQAYKGLGKFGTQLNLNTDTVGDIIIGLPSQQEIDKIIGYIDHETAKIDSLIEKQQQLIALLKEKRQAVISHAVTKGLNPNVKMKDSGVEWLGDVPEGWKVGKLGYYAKISNGATPNRENKAFWENGNIPWLNSSKINDVFVTQAEQFITKDALLKTSVQPVKENDILMAITGEGQTRGRVAICKISATINQHLAAISITDKLIDHEFLFLWLRSQYERLRFESDGGGATKAAITCGEIGAFPVVIPTSSEQKEIVKYIFKKNDHFDGLEEKAQYQIQLLQERRTALISAAVTGKIDLRDWQASAA